ncbi:PTS galactitol transporter subunit IIC [Thermoanaerobacterium thermosaccharolyticum]|jgi:galactitol PTS system EIIC component|uniref:PTS galactitol transporter subunit IIC n=1 Tax=Thermoanaerobacterium thermosaccharolyticum TaxID=1517 RepID=UPI00177C3073|nr:galactitol-specific PTS transporter subunit IIC [Thermoanaerobacterium thermosaccharolyticum]MBE0070076.1 PTS galactitol transporter subunit IIC [Thermoanaerobacterium thermosaccharolyticum]MBE0227927.1 PTS galactitol transporter subunit IIC [Thermoanaerobacterium thermosaccharolyticum]MCP2239026.1 PTS system galactitol-specific IIC component [Thermoanaerobacterium thermosaccharolyticum]
MSVIKYLLDLGAVVMLPIIIFILGLILGEKPGKAFRAAITIGIGFIGINLVIGLLVNNLGPAAQAMVKNMGVKLNVIDVGWPASSAIAFASKVGAFVIPLGLAINIIMLATRLTKTVNVDFWNYWHFAFTGALVAAATGNLTLGLIAAAINAAIVLKLADWTAKTVQDFYGLPGISLPHGFSAAYVPIAIPLNKLIDKIPYINKIEADPDTINKRFGIFGEPVVLGLILGLILGILAKFDAKATLNLGMSMAGVMFLMPRMVKILMEGLIPISEAAKSFMQKRFAGKEFYIGLDSAVAVGHPAAISTALILVPITILIAIILPGNKVLPFGDLATIPFMVAMIAPITKGNVFRSVLIGAIVIGVGLLIATDVAPLLTHAAVDAAFKFPKGASEISSICDGANPLTWIILKIMKLF